MKKLLYFIILLSCITLFACSEMKFIVAFDSNGGTYVAPIELRYGENIPMPEEPTKEGYTFVGWYYGNEEWDFQTLFVTGEITLVAKWEEDKCNVSFDSSGGTDVESISVQKGKTIPMPETPEKEGYTFIGWYHSNKRWNFSNDCVEGNITLTAQWIINSYVINFDTNGGSKIESIIVEYGSKIELPENPTKEGFAFAGWDQEIPETMPAKDIILIAIWGAEINTITFDTDGGNEIAPIVAEQDSVIKAPENPTKEGYTFVGWDQEIPSVMPSNDVTIKAIWQVNQYTIIFNTNGGSIVDDITADYNSIINSPSDPTKEGYTFVGWDQEIPSVMPLNGLVLNAIWEPIKDSDVCHSVTFDLNGGSFENELDGEFLYTILVNTYKNGWSVDKPQFADDKIKDSGSSYIWATKVFLVYNASINAYEVVEKAPGDGKSSIQGATSAWTHCLLYVSDAEYENIQVGQHFVADTEIYVNCPSFNFKVYNSLTEVQTEFIYTEDVSELPVPIKDGFKFLGWFNGETKVESIIIGTESLTYTLVAKWEEDGQDEINTVTISEAINENANLKLNEISTDVYTITATVVSITEEYNLENQTISLYISDGISQILVHRANITETMNIEINDVVTIVGQIDYKTNNYRLVNSTVISKIEGSSENIINGKELIIEEYALTNGWANGTEYPTIMFDEYTMLTSSGSPSCGKYYTSDNAWRLYQTSNASLSIASTKTIDYVIIRYLSQASGVLIYNEDNVLIGEKVYVNSKEITFAVGSALTNTSGQARITSIVIAYAGEENVTSFEMSNIPSNGIALYDTYQLEWKFSGINGLNQELQFTSGNEEVFTIDKNGLISAVGIGEAELFVSVLGNPDINATYTIKVYSSNYFKIECENDYYVNIGEIISINAFYIQDGNKITDLNWESLNPEIAIVENGVVTGISKGEAIIRISYEDNYYDLLISVVDSTQVVVNYDLNGGVFYDAFYAFVDEFAEKIVALFNSTGKSDARVTTRENFQSTSHPNVKYVFSQAENLEKYKWLIQLALDAVNESGLSDDDNLPAGNTISTYKEMLTKMLAGDTDAINGNYVDARPAFRQFIHSLINAGGTSIGHIEYVNVSYDFSKTENMAKVFEIIDLPVQDIYNENTYLKMPIREGYTFLGWFDENGNKVEWIDVENSKPIIKLKAQWEKAENTINAKVVTIANYALENSWISGKQYTEMMIDEYTTITVGGSINSGKYYSSDSTWRLYQSEKSTLTITSLIKIHYVIIGYVSYNSGELAYIDRNILSGEKVEVDGNKIEFGISEGQARVTSITIVYADFENTFVIADVPLNDIEVGENVTINAFYIQDGNKITDLNWESLNPEIAIVENGVVTGISEGEVIIRISYEDNYYDLLISVVDSTQVVVNYDLNGGVFYDAFYAFVDEFAEEIVALFNSTGKSDARVTTREDFVATTHPNVKYVFSQAENLEKYKWLIQLALDAVNEGTTGDYVTEAVKNNVAEMLTKMLAGDTEAINGLYADGRTAFRQFIHRLINIGGTEGNTAYNSITYDFSKTENMAKVFEIIDLPVQDIYNENTYLKMPIREGYTFLGWFDENGNKVEWIDVENSKPIINLKAQWDLDEENIEYLVEFYYGAEKINGLEMHYIEGENVSLPEYKLDGYEFAGWFDNEELVGKPITMISSNSVGNLVLYAKLVEINEVTVTFELDGGTIGLYPSVEDAIADFIGDYNASRGKNHTPETFYALGSFAEISDVSLFLFNENYKEKWAWLVDYISIVGSSANKVAFEAMKKCSTYNELKDINSNYIYSIAYELRAWVAQSQYTKNQYYYSNDYSSEYSKVILIEYMSYPNTYVYTEPCELPIPTKENYTFTGWIDKDGNIVTEFLGYKELGTHEITYTATWEVNSILNISLQDKTVIYDGNEHTIDLEGDLPSDLVITYQDKYVDAGVYTVKVMIQSQSVFIPEKQRVLEAKLIIEKREITVKPILDVTSKVYDGEAYVYDSSKYQVSVGNIVDRDINSGLASTYSLMVKILLNNTGEHVEEVIDSGDYYIYAIGDNGALDRNYIVTIDEEAVTYTIEKREITVQAVLDETSKTYDGIEFVYDSKTFKVIDGSIIERDKDLLSINVLITLEGIEVTEVIDSGVYVIKAVSHNGELDRNYIFTIDEEAVTYTIEKREITVQAVLEETSKTYDGEAYVYNSSKYQVSVGNIVYRDINSGLASTYSLMVKILLNNTGEHVEEVIDSGDYYIYAIGDNGALDRNYTITYSSDEDVIFSII